MKPKEAAQMLAAFEHDHGRDGREMVGLTSHAALPVVLNPELLHLLRINYFLDPPHMLTYAAEASLLLSSLCTEIDDGLYMIPPELRDLLLKRLIEDYGGARVRDVARLLWEYGERRAPWSERPGLAEAQQLTALNFIDHTRALNWLSRGRRGEGSLPVDDRWFVVLEQDLQARSAAVEQAEGEAVFLGSKLPALTELRDALMKDYGVPHAALEMVAKLDLPLPSLSEQMGASRLWQAVLDAAWISNRMPELLQAISELGTWGGWTKAISEYWFRLSPALRVENGRFQEPPPEWQILDQQRALIEQAIRALVVIVSEPPSDKPPVCGMGVLVGDYVVLTHKSMMPGSSGHWRDAPETRYFVELAVDHPTLAPQPGVKRLEVTLAGIQDHTSLAVLTAHPDSDRSGFPEPLRVMTDEPPVIKGRKVCVMGYPMEDSRVDARVLSRVMADVYGILRLQPGEILDEDLANGILVHNCFTAGGNGGSPLIDVQTGQVAGVHFSAVFNPGPRGLKAGNAISLFRLVEDPLLLEAGVFKPPSKPRSSASEKPRFVVSLQPDRTFVDRMKEQDVFLGMLEGGSEQLLAFEGAPGIGKTALLRQLDRLARERGFSTTFIDASELGREVSAEEILEILRVRLGIDSQSGLMRVKQDARIDQRKQAVLFLDDISETSHSLVDQILHFVRRFDLLVVFAGRRLPFWQLSDGRQIRVLRLDALGRDALEEWLRAEHLDIKDEVLGIVESMGGGIPSQMAELISSIREFIPVASESPNLADSLNNLGTGLSARFRRTGRQSDLDEAIRVYQQAVKATSPGSPDLPMYLGNLGTGLSDRFKHTGREVDLEEAIRIYQQAVKATPPDSPDLSGRLTDLGNSLGARFRRTGRESDLDEAIRIHQQAVKATPPDSPDVADRLNNLAELYYNQGQYAQAGPLYRRVLDIRIKVLGKEHPDTLNSMNNLAETLYVQGDLAGARKLEEQMLEARVRLLGKEHPDTLNSMNNLAVTLYVQGDLAGARMLQEQGLEARARLLGKEHPDTLNSMNNLAQTLYAQGDLAGARTLEEQVLEARARLLGKEHPDTLNSMNNLAQTLYAQGDLAGARTLQEQGLEARARLLGKEHPDTLNSMNNLAQTLYAQGDLAGARTLQEQGLEARARLLGKEHPDTLTSMNNLAQMLKAQGDLAGARTLEEQVLEARVRLLGKEHPDTLTSINNLAQTLKAQRDLAPMFAFDEDGTVRPADDQENSLEYLRANESIRRDHLNHPTIVERRASKLRTVRRWVDEADRHLARYAKNRLDMVSRSSAEERIRDIIREVLPQAEYSDAVKYLLVGMANKSDAARKVLDSL